VTPFHFGVGLLGKGLMPARVSVLAFVVSQVVIDCETAYFLFVAQEWPVHRWAHTFLVGTPIGCVAGLSVWAAAVVLRGRGLPVPDTAEWQLFPSFAGGALGGLTHPLLDGIMHADIQPLRPFLDGNPFLDWVGLAYLHLACLVAGAVGAMLCVVRLKTSRRALGLAPLAAASGPGPLDGDVPAHHARLHDAVPRKRGSSLPSPERW
jgi:hypothetical protein